MLRPLWRLLAVCTACALVACGESSSSGTKNPGDEITYELFASTLVLQPRDLAALASSSEDGKLVFAPEPAALRDVQVGQVLLGGMSERTPSGLLRVVAQVERGDGTLTLRTVGAPLQLAFRKLHARVRRAADTSGEMQRVPEDAGDAFVRSPLLDGGGSRSQRFDLVVFDGDGDEQTLNDQVKIDVTLTGAYSYDFSIDVDWGAIDRLPEVVTDCLASVANLLEGEPPSCSIDDLLPEAKTTFAVRPSLAADLTARGAASLDFERDFHVGTVHLPPIPLGPLVFVPSVDVIGNVKGGASARFEVGASASAELESSVVISTRTGGTPQLVPPTLEDWDVDVRPPTVDLHAFAEASVGARLHVSLFGIAGPYATASAIARIDAAPLLNPCWAVRLGLEADLGARITTPDLPLIGYVTLADWHTAPFRPFDQEVANGTCTIPADPPGPPGSGPTAGALQSPPFTPWAHVIGGAVDGTTAPGVGTLGAGSPALSPSIDGRWVAAGAFAGGLHKIDADGTLTWTEPFVWSGERALRALRSVPTRDAGLLALLRAEDGAAFVLAKSTQAGVPGPARAYDLPGDCIAAPADLARDASDGYVVLGQCLGTGEGWIVHLDAAGDVLSAGLLENDDAQHLVPRTALAVDGQVVVAGTLREPGLSETAFVTRLDAADRPTVSTAFGCPDLPTIEPTAIAASEAGGVTIAGTANGIGFVARVRKDGGVGFARFPNLGAGVADVFVVSAVAELPSTGLVIAASTGDATGTEPNAVVLAGLDGGGRNLWARRYALADPAPRALAWPALRLTDDGGAIVTAVAEPAGAGSGDLVAMKVHAKDGFLGDHAAIASAQVALGSLACTVAERTIAPRLVGMDVTVRPVALSAR